MHTRRRPLTNLVVGLHAALVLAAVAVPLFGVGRAIVTALGEHSHPGAPPIVDWARWGVLLGNTGAVAVVAVAVAVVLALPLAFLLARTGLPGRGLFTLAAAWGACLPVYVTAVFVFALVPLWRCTGSRLVCGALYGLTNLPLATLALAAAFRRVNADLEDQARLDAGEPTVWLRVTLPQVRWAVWSVAAIVFLLVATDYTIADLLMVRTFADEVYTQFALDRSAAAPMLAGLPPLVAVTALLAVFQWRYYARGEWATFHTVASLRWVRLGRRRWLIAGMCAAAIAAIVGVPGVAVWRRVESAERLAVGVQNCADELVFSTVAGVAAATVLVAVGVGLAWAVLRGVRTRWLLSAAIVFLLAVPAPVVGISLIELLNRPGWVGDLYDAPAIVVMGYFVRFLPLAVLLLIPAIHAVTRELEDAARLDGCDWLALQRHVYWPMSCGQAGLAWLILVILCFAEIGSSAMVAPPGWTPASVRAFTLLHFGVYADLAALALASSACILLPWVAVVALMAWRQRRAERDAAFAKIARRDD